MATEPSICTKFVEAALTESPIDELHFSEMSIVFVTLILGNHNVDYDARGTVKECRCSGFYSYGCPHFTSGGQCCEKFYCAYKKLQKVKNFATYLDEIKDMNLDDEQVQIIARRLKLSAYSRKEGGEKTELPHFYFF